MDQAQRRLAALQKHVASKETVTLQNTSNDTLLVNGELLYSITLPEKLENTSWHVHRYITVTSLLGHTGLVRTSRHLVR